MSKHVRDDSSISPSRPVSLSTVGEIDMASAKQLVRDVEAAVHSAAPADVELDLAGVTFIDSSGISALLLSRRAAFAAGCSFRISNVPPLVARTLHLAGVTAVLEMGDEPHSKPTARPAAAPTVPTAAAPVPEALAALSQYFVGHSTMNETLQRISEITRSALPRANHAAVSMTVDGHIGAHVFADPEIDPVDRIQYEAGEGPCIDAMMRREVVLIGSTRVEGQYSRFCKAASNHGVYSVLCLPMRTSNTVIGALSLYSPEEDAFPPDDIEVGTTFATQAAFVLANAQAYWDARTLSENLTQAMQSRAEIEQAKGIIMATAGLSAEAAFEQLVKQSQHENVKVRDLAAEIVRRSLRNRRP
jgi:anti-anti-sigma factor